MNKLKKIYLDHRGYMISGTVKIRIERSDKLMTVSMTPVFIPREKFSHNTIKRSINDGGSHCTSVDYALIDITDVYGFAPGYNQLNRTIELNKEQCAQAYITI